MKSKSSPEIHGEALGSSGVDWDQTRPLGIPGHQADPCSSLFIDGFTRGNERLGFWHCCQFCYKKVLDLLVVAPSLPQELLGKHSGPENLLSQPCS